MSSKIAIIGGTGIYDLPGLENVEKRVIDTPFGEVTMKVGILGGKSVAFITRHGEKHSIAPNRINFRANMFALREFGAKAVIATACSGSMNQNFQVGDFVLLEQFLDFTKARPARFYEDDESKPIPHLDFTNPYCGNIGRILLNAANKTGLQVKKGATYCCMEGPRFESAAEINMLKMLGGDLVGHTGYPEVVLAREAGMCYCSIGVVSNMAAGISDNAITLGEVAETMSARFGTLQSLLAETIRAIPDEYDCDCQHAIENAYA
ncbi:MAG: S-methyl-5'-thioinosine phosphorylase [Oscillospiraceae bacterium]|nr:S-methyl-5'-thioinosine phosphorylase [Oscillospiraceae bacterium]